MSRDTGMSDVFVRGGTGQAVLDRIEREFKAVRDPKLGVDRGEMVAYRLLADAQGVGNSLRVVALRNERHNLALAHGQRSGACRVRVRIVTRGPTPQLLQDERCRAAVGPH